MVQKPVKGNYTPIRILQTLLNILLLASVIGLMVH